MCTLFYAALSLFSFLSFYRALSSAYSLQKSHNPCTVKRTNFVVVVVVVVAVCTCTCQSFVLLLSFSLFSPPVSIALKIVARTVCSLGKLNALKLSQSCRRRRRQRRCRCFVFVCPVIIFINTSTILVYMFVPLYGYLHVKAMY